GEIELAEPAHPRTDALHDVREPLNELANDGVGFEHASLERRNAAARADRGRLPVGREAERDGALGDRVSEVAPGVDQLVEMLMQRLEQRPDEVPMQLLADQ